MSKPKPTTPIDNRQRLMLDALSMVTFLPGSFDKRFCRGIGSQTVITEKQAALLEQMYHRYRRQIPGHEKLCKICNGELIYPYQRQIITQIIQDQAKLKLWNKSVSPDKE